MSYAVSALVRAARLPRTMKRRPECKAVLLALADDCQPDGRNAWPAVATIAAEAEIGTRTADVCLAELKRFGFIFEQSPPRQHRPRTWGLDLGVIRAYAAAQRVATMSGPDTQDPATLKDDADPQDQGQDPQDDHADPQVSLSDPQHVADDPVLLNGRENGALNARAGLVLSALSEAIDERAPENSGCAASSLSGSRKASRGRDDEELPASASLLPATRTIILSLAHGVIETTGLSDATDPTLLDALATACTLEGYPDIAVGVLGAVLGQALVQRTFTRVTSGAAGVAIRPGAGCGPSELGH